jgi:hypothetical protein
MIRLPALLLLCCSALAAQDFTPVLEKADALLEESKKAYEAAKEKGAPQGFTDAAFKLEDARIKYLALQELGTDEMKKKAADRLKVVGQLSKLIHDGKVAISGKTVEDPVKAPAESAPPPAKTPEPAPLPAPPKVERAAVPDAARQRDAEKSIRDLYKADYAKKAPADRQILARTLLFQGDRSADDPAARWVLYKEAQELAAQHGDVDTALKAVDAQSKAFVMEPLPARLAVLTSAGKAAKTPADYATLTDRCLKLAEDAAAVEDFDTVDKASAAAGQHSRKSGDTMLAVKTLPRLKEFSEARARYDAYRKAAEALTRNPSDAPANLEMGQYLCFSRGEWEAGLFCLAKGSDAALKAVAEKDVTFPQEPDRQVEIADGWWDLADKEKSPSRKARFMERSQLWYERAAPQLSGLPRLKVDKRLSLLEENRPGPLNLLRLIDPKQDAVLGDWLIEGGKLMTPTDQAFWTRLQIPYAPGLEYDVSFSLKTTSNFYCLRIGLPLGDRQCMVVIGGDGGKGSGLEMIDNRSYGDSNPTFVAEGGTTPLATIVCSVRKGGITVSIDGKKIIDYKDLARLTLFGNWQVPNRNALFIASSSARFSIDQITLTPVGGAGKRLR